MSRPSWQLRDAALGYASRGIPVLPLHYPLPHRGGLQPVTGDHQPTAGGRLLVSGSGLRPARQAPPGQPGPPRGQGRHQPTGPGSWPGGPATPRPTSAWPPATASTSWTSTAPPAPRPSGAGRRPWPAELRAAGPHRRGWLALLPGPHRPRQRPPAGPGACGLAGPGRLCGRPTQPPRLRPPLPVGPRPRPRHPAGRGPGTVASPAGTPTASSGQLVRSSFRPPAPTRATAMRGRPWPRSWPGSPPPRSASATASCGSRPATSTTWSPPAPSTTARSTTALLAAAERCGLLAEEPRQTHRTLASGRQVGLAHPGRPRPAHQPRTHPRLATPPARAAGERTKEGR